MDHSRLQTTFSPVRSSWASHPHPRQAARLRPKVWNPFSTRAVRSVHMAIEPHTPHPLEARRSCRGRSRRGTAHLRFRRKTDRRGPDWMGPWRGGGDPTDGYGHCYPVSPNVLQWYLRVWRRSLHISRHFFLHRLERRWGGGKTHKKTALPPRPTGIHDIWAFGGMPNVEGFEDRTYFTFSGRHPWPLRQEMPS